MSQIEMVSLEELVKPDHVCRKYLRLWDFKETKKILKKLLKKLEKDNNRKGYGILRLFECLLLQFMEDLSDRELESYLQENTAAKLFCEFGLTEVTPHHTVFGKLRKKLAQRHSQRYLHTQGAIYTDKGYCVAPAKQAGARKGCHLGEIKKNNMKDKNRNKDRWYSEIRSPDERVFSKQARRVRYCGVEKNQFAAFIGFLCFNLKRLTVFDPPDLLLT